MRKKYKDEEWLQEKYVDDELTLKEISDIVDKAIGTLRYWMNKYEIKRRNHSESTEVSFDNAELYRDKEWLKEKYWNCQMSTSEIAQLVDVSKNTICYWMGKHNIEVRSQSERNKMIFDDDEKYKSREWLKEQYIDEELSTYEIASKLNCSNSTISRWLHRLDISTRDQPKDVEHITKICPVCGDKFDVVPSAEDKYKHCSKECYDKARKGNSNPLYKKETIRCDQCETTITREPSRIKEHNFCSQECQNLWQVKKDEELEEYEWDGSKIVLNCDYCNEEIKLKPSLVKGRKHHFCSKQCQDKWKSENMTGKNSPFWTGGTIGYYGPNWERNRKKVLKRDNYTCQACGETNDEATLDVHHLEKFRSFRLPLFSGEVKNVLAEFNYEQANRIENLITLCKRCHKIVEYSDKEFHEIAKDIKENYNK